MAALAAGYLTRSQVFGPRTRDHSKRRVRSGHKRAARNRAKADITSLKLIISHCGNVGGQPEMIGACNAAGLWAGMDWVPPRMKRLLCDRRPLRSRIAFRRLPACGGRRRSIGVDGLGESYKSRHLAACGNPTNTSSRSSTGARAAIDALGTAGRIRCPASAGRQSQPTGVRSRARPHGLREPLSHDPDCDDAPSNAPGMVLAASADKRGHGRRRHRCVRGRHGIRRRAGSPSPPVACARSVWDGASITATALAAAALTSDRHDFSELVPALEAILGCGHRRRRHGATT